LKSVQERKWSKQSDRPGWRTSLNIIIRHFHFSKTKLPLEHKVQEEAPTSLLAAKPLEQFEHTDAPKEEL
jgi:hypothetical protein